MNKLSVVLTITCSCSNNNKYSIRNDKLLLRSGLTVTAQDLGVAALPRGALGGAELGSLHGALVAESAVLAAGGGESALLAMLVAGLADPVDAGIITDRLVEGVDHDDFVPLEAGVLSGPEGIQDAEVAEAATDATLSERLMVAHGLALVDTLVLGLTVDLTLGAHGLAGSTADTHAEDGIAGLLLEPEAASLIGARSVLDADDGGHLTVLPAADTKQETHGVGLLLAPHLGEVLVSSHDEIG